MTFVSFISDWAFAAWEMLLDSAFLLLISFVLAGLLHLFLNADTIKRFVSGSRFMQVFKTAVVGVPLPLCSCSVLPVAWQLRRAGVSRGGTTSFLISTPESGVDSIFLTYSLMDPVMTVTRPISAFLTAMAAGGLESTFPDRAEAAVGNPEPVAACTDDCGCAAPADPAPRKRSIPARIVEGVRYGFTDLLSDLAGYLLVGYLLAGIVVAVFGGEMLALPESLRSGWGAYLGAIVIGAPLYICATSSTPLAAALIIAGFSPGAVLVFLLVGPATNVASLAVVGKILKGWGTLRYLVVIIGVAVLCGLAVDWLYERFSIPVSFRAGEEHGYGWHDYLSAVFLSLAILWLSAKKLYRSAVRHASGPAAT